MYENRSAYIIEELLLHLSDRVAFLIDAESAYLGKYCGETNSVHIGLRGCVDLAYKLSGDEQLWIKIVKYIAAHELGHSVDQHIELTSNKANEAVKEANKAANNLDEAEFIMQSQLFKHYMLKKELDAWEYGKQYLDKDDDFELYDQVQRYCMRTYETDCNIRRDKGLRYIREQTALVRT